MISDTKELAWQQGLVIVDSDRSQALIGSVSGQASKNLAAKVQNRFCTIMLTSLDGAPLSRAKRMLLTTGSRAGNTGMKWNEKRTSLTDWGTAPTVIEPVTGTIMLRGLAGTASARLASANAARAQAELEIARRGLVSTVVELYYNVSAGADRFTITQRALDEANRFVEVTQKREEGREAAHADVIKARLGQQQRQRELAEAGLANEKANLELGILLYPDPSRKFAVAEETAPPMLPDRPSVEAAARADNPELRSALATLQASQATTLSAWAGLTPDLALNYSYGIDAPQFASKGPDGVRNLGYSATATVDVPIWDWLTSERRVKEARIRAQASKIALDAAQRRMLADLTEFYNEADIARQQLASLDASVADAREALRLTNLRYVNGESTVLDVVDAQNTLVAAENGQVDGVVRYHLALAQLETLTGRL